MASATGLPSSIALAEAARRLADDVLAPTAEATDQSEMLPRARIDQLAGAGLLGLVGPPEYGGHAAPPPVIHEIHEILAGACGVTYFVWLQHHAPVRMLAGTDNSELRDRYLRELCQGSLLGGMACTYPRRTGPPAITARRVGGGWEVNGQAPWVTAWGLADLYAFAAVTADEEVLMFCLPGRANEHIRASPPLALAAMGASATVHIVLDGLFVSDANVLWLENLALWRYWDSVTTCLPGPNLFGLARTCTRLLGDHAASSGSQTAVDAALALQDEWTQCRQLSYRLSDELPDRVTAEGRFDEDFVSQLLANRTWAIDVMFRSAQALVASVGGRAIDFTHPAQRLLREATFYCILAQTPVSREATVATLAKLAPLPTAD